MYAAEREPSRTQTLLLTAAMLAILAGSTVLAWTLTLTGEDPAARGAQIIAQLKRDTLDKYWTADSRELCFVGSRPGMDPEGWQVRTRGAARHGIYSGRRETGIAGAMSYREKWLLRSDLSGGTYTVMDKLVTMEIRTSKNEVKVIRAAAGRIAADADAARPDNYVPNGALEPVLRLAAIGGQEAVVKTILRNTALKQGRVNLVTTRLIPLGQTGVRVEYTEEGVLRTMIYRFDQGAVHRIEYLGPDKDVIYKLCSREALIDVFPGLRETVLPDR